MKTNKSAKSVALYARVSSEQQADAATIASQVAAIKQRVAEDGFSLEPELCFLDEGYSGATLVRPALERLRDLAATGAIDRLYVHSPDRLARKYAYQVLLLDELDRCGVEVVFLNHPRGKTAEEELLMQVQGMVAEYERAKILERSRRGKLHAARQGSVNVLSGAPYGYRYVRAQEGEGEARYEVILEEARVVRQIYGWVGRDGLSIGEVCRRLKKRGIPTRTGKSYWDRATVWGVLKNPAYQGTARFGKTRIGPRKPLLRPQRGRPEQPRRDHSVYDQPADQGILIAVPALVSEALFAAVQERLVENRQRNRQSRRGAKYLLQGLVVCRCCGYAFYGKPVSTSSAKGKPRHYAYYRCIGTDAYRFGGERICANKQVRTDLLEEAVWEDVCGLLRHPKRIQHEYQRRLKHDGSPDQDIQQLQTRIQSVKRGIARLVDAYEDGLLEKTDFAPRIRRLRDRLAKLEAEAQAAADQQNQRAALRLVIGQLEEFARHVENGLQDADWAQRREIIRALVKRIEVDEGQVQVVYRIAPSPFEAAPNRGRLQDCWRREGATLRRPRFAGLNQTVGHDARPQEPPDQPQHATVVDLARHADHQHVVLNPVEEFRQVHVHGDAVARLNVAFHLLQRPVGGTSWPEAEARFRKARVEDRREDLEDGLLDHAIQHGGDAEHPLAAAVRFRDDLPADR